MPMPMPMSSSPPSSPPSSPQSQSPSLVARASPKLTLSPDDNRDYLFADVIGLFGNERLPPAFNASPRDGNAQLFPARMQQANSCVAYSLSSISETHARALRGIRHRLSPQFIYDRRSNDPRAGMYPREGTRLLLRHGICPEDDCPAATGSQGDAYTCPANPAAAQRATTLRCASFYRVATLKEAKVALYNVGPILIVLPYFTDAADTVKFWKAPSTWRPESDTSSLHAVTVEAYDDGAGAFLVRNSWGTSWGSQGSFLLPYADFALVLEAWVVLPVIPDSPPPSPTNPNHHHATCKKRKKKKTDWVLILLNVVVLGALAWAAVSIGGFAP